MGKNYERLALNLRGFIVDDYIVFYYPRENGINITRVVGGYRDLESIKYLSASHCCNSTSAAFSYKVLLSLGNSR
ncbi:MAG: hypothetical protein AAF915_19485 [Cyanobacteria bacterium P01_D01_bin.50]